MQQFKCDMKYYKGGQTIQN